MPLCGECGATLAEDQSCQDHFHQLLALEWMIPEGAGLLAHFFAVAAYCLQHPVSMNLTTEALEHNRKAVTEALAGRVSIEQLRENARAFAARADTRVTRRDLGFTAPWSMKTWEVNVTDILVVPPQATLYLDAVRRWAAAVTREIDQNLGSLSPQS